MNDTASADGETTEIRWTKSPHTDWPNPMVGTFPYVELKLEHPDLAPTRYGESFFPDAVPYEFDGDHRVFYWRPTLDASTSDRTGWEGICATTDALSVVTESGPHAPDLVSRRGDESEVVVGGTVAGDSTTTLVGSYSVPDVRIRELSASRLELLADGTEYVVPAGTRRRVSLAEQTVERADGDGGTASVTPELVVRFPGERELHHPAPGAEYRLFPSFGLELDTVSRPVPVPTTKGELDYAALATSLGVDLSNRPYPERVLWQAFAYTAFDPHTSPVPRLTQFPTGRLALRTGPIDG
ncbi:hypothetical protein [Halorussus salinisoli]|uniref:hypothetical protein n=1 Tax=Halorussus salinisoli TaxID=2558242 RepID=UPI0010C220D8|nr:hypothetical protein [Halorussus salinisoli]